MTGTRRLLTANDFPLGHADDGWRLCRICKTRVPMKHNTTCSGACRKTIDFMCRVDVQKRRVWERDKGICAKCGVDTFEEHKKRHYGVTPDWRKFHCWDLDHIVPVTEGGGVRPGMTIDEAMANLRTLCSECHKAETKAWHGRRAASR